MKLSGDPRTGEYIVSDVRTGIKTRVVSLTTGQRLMGLEVCEEIPVDPIIETKDGDNDDFSELSELFKPID